MLRSSIATAAVLAHPGVLFGGEAAVLVSRQVGARWWIVGGPIISKDVANDGLPDVTYEPELTVFAGVSFTR